MSGEVEIVPNNVFREFVLTNRQYWVGCYEEAKHLHPNMTLDEYLDIHWQNRHLEKEHNGEGVNDDGR